MGAWAQSARACGEPRRTELHGGGWSEGQAPGLGCGRGTSTVRDSSEAVCCPRVMAQILNGRLLKEKAR